ncbi:SSI family serine proteinase inhibitor [Streptomyces sp. SL13]|uniref:SSI family serine proteinase inhibitor n=1 Tax=Streptantibioticus silvisoli TaxID=2705255 RepID=A0AA90K0X0_9ACTN|nr:SSI family serine proteinase inhibitor [Streptantibioticus silvisoli]MDI5961837.1 SSI family serine proteinase inhibitor [Streptantibioticus silvisoli]MDI5973391.1 SSI family serine proteinase inhibitor [Streptantibioticus silvisoli]
MSVARRAATAAIALAALAAATPTALAAPQGPSRLVLSVSTPARAISPAAPRSVVLDCDPASGPHPNAGEACTELDAAGGGLADLVPVPEMCPMIYNPVTATATGTWQGRPVSWSQRFANSCMLARSTGAVFRF